MKYNALVSVTFSQETATRATIYVTNGTGFGFAILENTGPFHHFLEVVRRPVQHRLDCCL